MESLQDILGGKRLTPPGEMTILKEYVQHRYNSTAYVKIDKDTIILSVPSSALAATIQLERQILIKKCGLKKRLVVRTGR